MALPLFPTLGYGNSGPVSPSASWATKAAILTAKFGGRYNQRTGDGINTLPRDFSYQSKLLKPDKFKVLDDFLISRGGYRPFLYTVPGESTSRQFICSVWSARYDTLLVSLVATFEENFDP